METTYRLGMVILFRQFWRNRIGRGWVNKDPGYTPFEA